MIQELLLRHRARTAVIVCPPSLSLKWQDEMRDKFGLDFTIVNSELMAQVRRTHGLHANPFLLFPRVIVSHGVAAAGAGAAAAARRVRAGDATRSPASGSRSTSSSSTRRTTSPRRARRRSPADAGTPSTRSAPSPCGSSPTSASTACSCRATPHNGHPESFTALMEMIDSRRFSRGALLDSKALKDVTVRRLKRDLTGKGFKNRTVNALDVHPARRRAGDVLAAR